jgi:hypothetical protein
LQTPWLKIRLWSLREPFMMHNGTSWPPPLQTNMRNTSFVQALHRAAQFGLFRDPSPWTAESKSAPRLSE